jgi:hypothetical protein
MFCATHFKLAALLLLEITQSDQSGFRPSFSYERRKSIPTMEKMSVEQHFQHDKKCLTRTSLFSLFFIQGLRSKKEYVFFCRD